MAPVKRPRVPRDLPLRLVVMGLISFSALQWMGKAALLRALRREEHN